MSRRIKRQAQMLKFLSKATPKTVKAIVTNCDGDLVDAISECSLNILKGNVPLKKCQHKRLSKYKNHLRCMTNKNISKRRKKALLQKGGFLQALLSPVLSVLASILT